MIGINPTLRGPRRVTVVTCKSWQGGFHADRLLAQLRGERKNPKRETWRHFRELWKPKWSEAFRDQVESLTGAKRFEYRIAVTRLHGDHAAWAADPTIKRNLPGCRFGFITMAEMWNAVLDGVTERPAPSEIGRLAQLLKAAGSTPPEP